MEERPIREPFSYSCTDLRIRPSFLSPDRLVKFILDSFSRLPSAPLRSMLMESVSPSPDPVAMSSVIDADLPCSICSYNLKGLAPDANCPECGQAIARTYQFN